MGLESATFINQLNASNPVGAVDPKSQGDDHLRLIKSALQASFPNITGAMTVTHANLNQWGGLTAAYNWSGQHRGIDGTVGAPAFSFVNDPDTGIYRANPNEVRLGAGGALTAFYDTTRLELNNGIQFRASDGAVGTPSISFGSDTDTGAYHRLANTTSFAAAGTLVADIAVGGIDLISGVLVVPDGAVGAPSLSFRLDTNTGIYRAAADDMRLVAGGVDGFIVQSGALFAQLPLNIPNGAAGAGNNSIRFGNDTDTGFYRVSADYLAFEAGGTFVYAIRNVAGAVQMYGADGTAAAPMYAFNSDADTGFYRIGADLLGFSEGGTGYRVGFRDIPRSTTATTLASTDVGRCVAVSAAINIPASVFGAGSAISIYNDSAAAVNITISAGTLRLGGTTTTGTRTLAARGMATLWFNVGGATPEVICTGAGVS